MGLTESVSFLGKRSGSGGHEKTTPKSVFDSSVACRDVEALAVRAPFFAA